MRHAFAPFAALVMLMTGPASADGVQGCWDSVESPLRHYSVGKTGYSVHNLNKLYEPGRVCTWTSKARTHGHASEPIELPEPAATRTGS